MRPYHCYVLDGADHILGVECREYADDASAIRWANELSRDPDSDYRTELWCRDRRVDLRTSGPATRKLLTPAQCRAARALLGWTQAILADRAGVARRTIAHFEVGRRVLLVRTRREIAATLERAGIEFVWPMQTGGEGVRLTCQPESPPMPQP